MRSLLSALEETSVTTQRLPALSKTRLSGDEKPCSPGSGRPVGPPADQSSQVNCAPAPTEAGSLFASRRRRIDPWVSLTVLLLVSAM
ncbi:hypothetical protein DVA67_006380 [Solirubrobacter sp. CPCC 204708]|nr:hypothetical protein [Solirubrobacter deserti]